MQIREISIDEIDFGERLRSVDPDYVQLIAHSIQDQGQRTPIDVRLQVNGRFALIAGAHRTEACRLAGLTTVRAVVHDVDDLTAQLIEVDENLMRQELTALDRAAFLARRKELYIAKFPEAAQRGSRAKGKGEPEYPFPTSFSKDAAKKLNLTRRWVDAAISFHARLAPDAKRRLSGTRLADNAKLLIELSHLATGEQLPVVEQMLDAAKPARTVAVAVERLFQRTTRPAIAPNDARYRRFVADWTAGGPELHDQVIAFLKRQGLKVTSPKNGD